MRTRSFEAVDGSEAAAVAVAEVRRLEGKPVVTTKKGIALGIEPAGISNAKNKHKREHGLEGVLRIVVVVLRFAAA